MKGVYRSVSFTDAYPWVLPLSAVLACVVFWVGLVLFLGFKFALNEFVSYTNAYINGANAVLFVWFLFASFVLFGREVWLVWKGET